MIKIKEVVYSRLKSLFATERLYSFLVFYIARYVIGKRAN